MYKHQMFATGSAGELSETIIHSDVLTIRRSSPTVQLDLFESKEIARWALRQADSFFDRLSGPPYLFEPLDLTFCTTTFKAL